MQNSYILKNKNQELLCFYYGEQKSIYYKKYNNNWEKPVKVIDNVCGNFTVDFYKNGEIYIFCQNLAGDVILCKEEKENFKQKMIFKNEKEKRHISLYYALLNENGMTLLYNGLQELKRSEALKRRHIGYEQMWSEEEVIDSFVPLNLGLFKVQKIKNDHLIMLYKKSDRETVLGYREMNQTKVTSFNIFSKTAYQVTDQTFLATENAIHFLYVVKNMFTSQIIYRKRDERGFSSPVVLYEGNKVKSCSLAILKNSLYAFWTISNNLFYSNSNNNGETFNSFSKYKRPIAANSKKVDFINFNKMNSLDFVLNEVYVDANNLTDIQFLQEEFPNIFEKNLKEPVKDVNNLNNTLEYSMPRENFYIIKDNILHDNFMSNFTQDFDKFFEKNKKISNNEYNKRMPSVPNNLENTSIKSNVKNLNIMENTNDQLKKFNDSKLNQFKNFDGFEQFNTPPEKDDITNLNKAGIETEIVTLQTKLNTAQNQINQKDKQISDLNNTIKQKEVEKQKIEQKLKQEIKVLKEEQEKMLEKNIEKKIILEDENILKNYSENYFIEENLKDHSSEKLNFKSDYNVEVAQKFEKTEKLKENERIEDVKEITNFQNNFRNSGENSGKNGDGGEKIERNTF